MGGEHTRYPVRFPLIGSSDVTTAGADTASSSLN